jgi:hypothetical protein
MSENAAALRVDALGQLTGRPRNSPGWGRLLAVKNARVLTSEGDHAIIGAGRDRVAPDSSYAQEYPELFRPADRRDKATAVAHLRNLTRAMARLEGELRTAPPSVHGLDVAAPARAWELGTNRSGGRTWL